MRINSLGGCKREVSRVLLTRFCPACRAENGVKDLYCRACGAPLVPPTGESYGQMLVWALEHPQPEVRLRAASFLGRLGTRSVQALPDLFRVFRHTEDVYLRAEIATALGAIGGETAYRFLLDAIKDESVIVRLAVVKALAGSAGRLPRDLRSAAGAVCRRLASLDPSESVRELAHELTVKGADPNDLPRR